MSKISSVISKFINYDAKIVKTITAGYDRDKLKPGYKGSFVIQRHKAERAGNHFDIRIEFPVTSLDKALKHYTGTRPKTNEPKKEYSEKSGTVYRSFVDKKMELPTSKKKIYLIETENHPKQYGKFHGTIEEGYGKGTVEIWDSGSYELLDVDGDQKYVIDFKGSKLKGVYALIKYQKGYLWVKTKSKEASVIDYVRPTMDPQIWVLDKDPPAMNDKIRSILINTFIEAFEDAKMKRPLRWLEGLFLSGSSTSYNYKEDGDVDVDILYDPVKIRGAYPELSKLTDKDLFEYLQKIINKRNSKSVLGTSHRFSYMILKPGDKPVADGIFNLLENKWVKGPIKIPVNFDPDEAFVKQKMIALEIGKEVDLLIAAIVQITDDLRRVDQYEKHYGGVSKKRVLLMYRLRKFCTELNNWYDKIWALQENAARGDMELFYPAFDFSPNWSEEMIIFKYLARYGYHRCIQTLYNLLKDSPYLEIIDQIIPD